MSTVTSGADRVRLALPCRVRAPLAVAGTLGAVVAITLGVVFAGQATGSGLDRRIAAALELPQTFSSPVYTISWVVQSLSDPIPALILVLLLVAACLRCGRRRLAVLAVAGPLAADLIVIVTKHLVGRTIHHGSLSYPSTHTAQSTAFAMVTAMLIAAMLGIDGGVAAALVLGAAATAALVMGWALVAGNVHYATDTLAGFCVAVAIVPTAAWCTDLVGNRVLANRHSGVRA
jgi:membrane-associated phospholipid phosphatase